ncbi:putative amidoligase enzyme-domain-containing protein [Nemania serpens]|nr:putative amidoligase enzyme-domain-containing protein [Nemania serpens]
MAYIQKIDEMIEASEDSGGTLSCGVEMEFLVPSVHLLESDPDPDLKDQHLYRTIERSPGAVKKEICAKLLETLRQLCGVPFRNMDDDEFLPPHDNVVDYSCWRIGRDITVNKDNDLGFTEGPYQWTDCELTSPVMSSTDYVEQIDKICGVLKTIRIHLNQSTAVHVHVGRGDEPFSLLTIKKFSTLYWFTEKAILELHHPSRLDNKYCFRLTKFSDLATKAQADFDADEHYLDAEGLKQMDRHVPKAALTALQHRQIRRIWGCANMEEPEGKTGGNIQTFEWRQMSGSVNADHINQWVKACVEFTDFCRHSSEARFKELVEHITVERGAGYSGIELLQTLSVDTRIFTDMLESWARDSSFCDDTRGSKLFVPK